MHKLLFLITIRIIFSCQTLKNANMNKNESHKHANQLILEKILNLFKYYLPNKILNFSKQPSELPLLKGRHVKDKTYIYLCVNNTHQLPKENVKEIVKIMNTKL